MGEEFKWFFFLVRSFGVEKSETKRASESVENEKERTKIQIEA